MSIKKTLKFRGEQFDSLADLARKYNIEYNVLQYRLSQDYTLEEAVSYGESMFKVTVLGKEYLTLADACRTLGIDYSVIRARVNNGYSLDEAFLLGESAYSIVVFGKEFKNLRYVAEHFGVDYSYLVYGLELKVPVENRILQALRTEPLIFRKKKYKNLTTLCNEYFVDLHLVFGRLKRGWTMEEALLRPAKIQKPIKTYEYRGKIYSKQSDLANAFGFTKGLVSFLSQREKIDFVKALDIYVTFFEKYPIKPPIISSVPFIIYNDEWYSTLKEFCESVGLTNHKVKDTMRHRGIKTYYEALTQMSQETNKYWVETETNQIIARSKAVSKYGAKAETLIKKGIIEQRDLRVNPDCTFNPNLPFYTPELDFREYLKSLNITQF